MSQGEPAEALTGPSSCCAVDFCLLLLACNHRYANMQLYLSFRTMCSIGWHRRTGYSHDKLARVVIKMRAAHSCATQMQLLSNILEYVLLSAAQIDPHSWQACPFSHPNEKASRRDFRKHRYTSQKCPDSSSESICPRGDACPMSHHVRNSLKHFYHLLIC